MDVAVSPNCLLLHTSSSINLLAQAEEAMVEVAMMTETDTTTEDTDGHNTSTDECQAMLPFLFLGVC